MSGRFQRARRRKVDDAIAVVDTMTGEVVGQLGNLSETGMLLMARVPMVDDALFQLRFDLDDAHGSKGPVELGAHLLWQHRANAPGQAWAGFRFIGVPEDQMQRLRRWIDAPGGHFE